jgi:5-deoxy-glucuronate isomerase
MSQPTLHFRQALTGAGYQELVSPACAPLENITLGLLRLCAGESHQIFASAQEIVLIVLQGKLVISGNSLGAPRHMERKSIFEEAASALYIAPGDEITVCTENAVEIAVAKAPCIANEKLRTQTVMPANLRRREVGEHNWCRTVYDVIPGDFAAHRLILGETFNPPGNWSSSPPHKHDQDKPPHESKFEEVYFYRFDPPQGFALQRVYSAEGDLNVCYAVEHNDVVVLPRGYHPVVAAPGYRLYYLWVLAGRSREPVWFEDPAHSWIHGSQNQPTAEQR